jgi:hypothetical protein
MKRLLIVFLLVVSVFSISACSEGGITGNLLKPSLTAQESNNLDKEDTSDNTLTGYDDKSLESKNNWLERIKTALRVNQKSKSSGSPTLSSLDGGKGGEWILLRNDTEMNCLDADYNLDLMVTLPDFGMFAVYYTNHTIEADLNYDGEVSLSDFAIFGSYYNNCDYSGNETNATVEYYYEIEIDEDFTINATNDTPVMTFSAWGQPDTGFKVGDIETSRVLAEFPRTLGGEWGPLYYQDNDGDYQQAPNVTRFYIWPQNQDKWAEIDYNDYTGKLRIEGSLLPYSHNIWVEWNNNTNNTNGFEYFGNFAYHAEPQELYMPSLPGQGDCGGYGGYYGTCDEDVIVGDYMVIRNPEDNFDHDKIRFSIYL